MKNHNTRIERLEGKVGDATSFQVFFGKYLKLISDTSRGLPPKVGDKPWEEKFPEREKAIQALFNDHPEHRSEFNRLIRSFENGGQNDVES